MSIRKSERRARHLFNQQIIEGIIQYAFKVKETEKSRKLESLLYRNAELLNTTPSFIFNEKYYTVWGRRRERGDNRQVHSSLYRTVAELLDEGDFDEFVERSKMQSYLRKVFSVSQHRDDLYALVPHRLSEALSLVGTAWSTGDAMTAEQIEAFRKENKQDYSAFTRMFLVDLITS